MNIPENHIDAAFAIVYGTLNKRDEKHIFARKKLLEVQASLDKIKRHISIKNRVK